MRLSNNILYPVNRKVMIIGEDHDFIRTKQVLLEETSKYLVSSFKLGLVNLKEEKPGLIIYDYQGTKYLYSLKQKMLTSKIHARLVVFITEEEIHEIRSILEIGVDGVFLKGRHLSKLIENIQSLNTGLCQLSPEITNYLVKSA